MVEYASTMSQVGLIPPKQGIFEESSTPKANLGQVIEVGNRKFVYCKNGSVALAAGKFVIAPAQIANHTNIACSAAVSIGDTVVTPTLGATAATLNQYQDGWLIVNDATGEGYTYKIKSNPAADASATCAITLYDPIQVALTTSSEVTLVPNPFSGVVISSATAASNTIIVGVPSIAVTASYYFWAQFRGVCSCLAAANVTHPAEVYLVTTAGGFDTVANAYDMRVGRTMYDCVSTEYPAIILDIPGIG